jgi:23S rRNA U2552 (ribose-2'-O)-methylase RlmE/FtsJ
MAHLDTKTIGGWLIAILLSGFTAFATSKQQSQDHSQQIETKQIVLEQQVEFLKSNQEKILKAVESANTGITEIKIQLNLKADKQWRN